MSEAVNAFQSAANQAIPFEERTEVTAEDLEKISPPHPVELYNGKVVFKSSWPLRGIMQNNVAAALKSYLRHNRIGYVTTETSFQLWPDRPQELRLPDVAFLKRERVPEKLSRFPKLAPDLAVEIISPNDTCEYVFGKLNDYCKQGLKAFGCLACLFRKFGVGLSPAWSVFPSKKS